MTTTLKHEEHITLETWNADCIEGECDHVDEDGMPEDLSACPSSQTKVCVDCMDEQEKGRDPDLWEQVTAWPCDDTPPEASPAPEPSIFKPTSG